MKKETETFGFSKFAAQENGFSGAGILELRCFVSNTAAIHYQFIKFCFGRMHHENEMALVMLISGYSFLERCSSGERLFIQL